MVKGSNNAPHTALYRKYRPRTLDEFVGQSHVVEILRRSLKKGKIAHAYLLTGPKGTGKTTIARILAHDINELPYDSETTHLDIIEIDAASNNGVDDVRDLREKVQLAPTSAAKKVYIIDEVHMLSKAAFNALLKTLEEPPAHVVFILATTDLHKVPATIISRTQHFSIHTYGTAEVSAHLKKIAESEKIKISDEALKTIAERGEGSFRNSISMLDQLASFADDKDGITLDLVETTLGLAPTQAVDSLLAMVNDRDIAGILATLDQLEEQGIQPVVLADQLTRTLRFRLAEQPQLVHLLDALLSVAGSPQPQLKLLTVLIGAIKPKTAATYVSKAPAVVIEAPVPKLPAPKKTEEKKEKVVVQPISEPEIEAEAETKPAPIATGPKKPIDAASFDWVKIIEHAKKNFVALYSVLLKCEYQLDGDTLTIYAGRKFNKTKLDDTKYLTQLHETLIETGVGSVNIITLAETKPLEDAELAKVAAIMGGGKAVPVGESGETA